MCARRCCGQSGMPGNEYADGMIEHDGHVGQLLEALDDLGIADNTIVVYTTDNGPNQFSWPDAATTPFRCEKDTNWEGAFRVPAIVRWPGPSSPARSRPRCSPASTGSRRCSPPPATPTSRTGCCRATQVGDTQFKVHLDGYNQLPLLTGEADRSARKEFAYFDDDGQLVAYRYGNWKTARIALPAGGAGVIESDGFIWVTSPLTGQIFKVDPETNTVAATLGVGGSPTFIAAGEGALWVVDQRDATVLRVDPESGSVVARIATGEPGGPGGDIDAGGGFVWVACARRSTATQIDPATNTVAARYASCCAVFSMRHGAGSVWIAGPDLLRLRVPERE